MMALTQSPMPAARILPVESPARPAVQRADQTALVVSHVPLRPGFDCARCGQPWPCAPAKVELAEQYHGNTLSLGHYLSVEMADAMQHAVDPGWGRVDNLYDRFLGWIPRGRSNPHAA